MGKRRETSRDSEETSLDHKGFSLDAVSFRKLSGTAKFKDDSSQNFSYNSEGHGGWKWRTNGEAERENCGGHKDFGVREVFQKQSPSEVKASIPSCR